MEEAAYGDEYGNEYGDEYGEEKKDELEQNDGKKGTHGIKKTDLEFEDKNELISVFTFRLTDIFNPKDPSSEQRKFDL